ncbi:CRISPR-associated endoribonuclease Cas6 [Hydrogenivirga caldilitoris]|uniref:CRISPR-associated endoribonuclease Cas6 n=1 Tax=Hydrogenivirga caldilitoris TaxID=246264 RepID=A0A497XPB2_9AQUI|nr:CRISPR system precrRNA processing endoribonuclease RAMP protein Cas6 [Hydrogenivirga caldilitoris]RLJ70816.1 CRISPR-associated endoribonuclease Cas6 [Hydrogenivirga caldilitoris]
MPVRLSVPLIPEKPVSSSLLTPDRAHGLFFSLLDEKTAEELHKPAKIKPFCLWFPQFFGEEKELDRINLHISFLKESLFPAFLSSLILEKNDGLFIENVKLRKLRKPYIREDLVLSYEDLYKKSVPENTIVLDFLTPTSFKRGEHDYPLPDPAPLFKGLIRKWVRFSGVRIEKDLREMIQERIAVAGAWIKTKKVELSKLDIKELLGHSRLDTTTIYTHTDYEKLKRIVEGL